MMCARSVSRSISALHTLGLGITCDHSENGRLVVTITAAFSALSAITWNINSLAVLAGRDTAVAERDVAAAERDAALAQNDRLRHLLLKLRRTQFGAKSERLP